MLLKKPSVLVSSYAGIHNFNCPNPQQQIYTSSNSLDHRRPLSTPPQPLPCTQRRGYAGGAEERETDGLRWPEARQHAALPTPYQIFCQRKGSAYSKRRFYELVKLYHPDRHASHLEHDASRGLSRLTRLERYRLVVAANDILSDPVKRNAYDRYGAGWNGLPEASRSWRQNTTAYGHGSGGGSHGGWGHADSSPSQNATWEDWERWYQRDTKRPQQPLFFANGAFVSLIVMLAALGGVGQATRVGNYSMSFLEEVDRHHDETSKDLIRRRRETTTAYGHRDERIESFLRMRDPSLVTYGVAEDPSAEEGISDEDDSTQAGNAD